MTPDHDPTRTSPPDATCKAAGDRTRPQPERSFATGAAAAAICELNTATAATVGSPTSPQALGDGPPGFAIDREVGVGGMGVVYLANQLGLNRPVALKLVKGPHTVDSKALIRFLAEAEAVAAVRHPNVVEVHQYGEHAGRPFLALEYCPGGDLTTLTKAEQTRDPAWFRKVAELMAQVADGVNAAHAQGVVHRDLKPHNVLLAADGTPKVADFGLAKRGLGSDLTRTDPVIGTPAYMAPEQAGGTKFVGPEADVWALGVMLYELCCGQRPLETSGPILDALARVAHPSVPPVRSILPAVPADLALIAHKCLSPDPRDRYPTAAGLAADLRRWLAGEPITARRPRLGEQVGRWVKRNPARAVFLAAAGLVAVGGLVAAFQVQRSFAEQRLAAERQRQEGQRRTRAETLVDALPTADTAGVPRIVADLADLRDLARPKLSEMASQPVSAKPGLHARLALLPDEPQRAEELAAHLPACKPEELLPVRNALKSHAAAVAPGLWAVLRDATDDGGRRVRAACALAGLTPGDERWAEVAAAVAEATVRANPVEFVAWSAALEPVRAALVPRLMERYLAARAAIRGGRLDESALAAAVGENDLSANLLARYAADRPKELAELALTLDGRHFPLFTDAIRANRAAIVPLLQAELGRRPGPTWAVDDGGVGLAAAAGCAGSLDVVAPDAVLAATGMRKGHAAAVLLALGEAEGVWPVFRSPADGDPTPRSHLLERVAAIRVNPGLLVRRFEGEEDVSAKRAVLIALGDFPPGLVPDREAVAGRLLVMYREHPDSGLHSAIDWVLRQKWGRADDLAAIDAELASAARARVAARGLADLGPGPLRVGPLLPAPAVVEGRDWFVNGEGQTFAVFGGPVEFTLGSAPTEPGRDVDETPHRKRIGRTFAVATREVTVAEFTREFRPGHSWWKRHSPGPDTPVVSVTWYDCAEYCNWLSAREGVPPDQWCYEPNEAGKYAEGMRIKPGHLQLTGYRLPTEAEWEYACRGGATTARSYGRGEELLPRYGWFPRTSDDRAWPVGRLRPNERGLFDGLGNVWEWCEGPGAGYRTDQRDDTENPFYLKVDERMSRPLRSGSFNSPPIDLRCASRYYYRPGNQLVYIGVRPARTLVK